MEMNQLTQQADKLLRRVVSKYNTLYSPSGEIAQVELDLLLDDLRHLYDTFKTISHLNASLNLKPNVPLPQTEPHNSEPSPASSAATFPNAQNTSEPEAEQKPIPVAAVVSEEKKVVYTLPAEADENEIPTETNSTFAEKTLSSAEKTFESDSFQENQAIENEQALLNSTASNTEPQEVSAHTTASHEVTQTKSHTIADSFKTPDKSLSDTLINESGNMLGSRVLIQPISDLPSAIGLNDKFSFISDLFNNDAKAYEDAISRINKAVNFDEGMWILQTFHTSTWDENKETVKRLTDFVKRRFI